jgi:membrane-associated phospholipid phosphatase
MKSARTVFILFSVLLISASAEETGRNDTPAPPAYGVRSFFTELGQDFELQAKAPFSMTEKEVTYTGAGVLVDGGLMFADIPVATRVRHQLGRHGGLGDASTYVSELGGTAGILSIGVVGAFGWIAGRPKEVETAALMAQAAITSGVWCQSGKILTGRSRPSASWTGGEYQDLWHGPVARFEKGHGGIANYDAFPSGHTTTAFSLAAVAASQYGEQSFPVRAAAYSVAGLVGLARLGTQDHWASDVFAGACLGYLCGKQVVAHHRHLREGPASHASSSGFYILPCPQGAVAGYTRTL